MPATTPHLTICSLCQDSIRFDRPFSCNRVDCPVKRPKPLIFRWWFVLTGAAVIAVTASIMIHLWVKARDLTRIPRILNSEVQETTWRGQPWQAHVEANGYGNLTYQWYSGFVGDISDPVPAATSNTLKISNLQEKGRYWLLASNKYGTAMSGEILVTPQTVDTADLDRELDEVLFFSRAILEQTYKLAIFEGQISAIDEIDPDQKKVFQDFHAIAVVKQNEALGKLEDKLRYLQKNADLDAINRLFDARRAESSLTENIDDQRVRKTFSLSEAAWRATRDGNPLPKSQIIDYASKSLPF